MNRIIIAFILLCLVLSLCFFGSQNSLNQIEETMTQLEEIEEMVAREDFPSALSLSQTVKEQWEKKHTVLCMYISHDRLEAIDESISAMPPLIRHKESGLILSECGRVLTKLQDLKENESLSIENIL